GECRRQAGGERRRGEGWPSGCGCCCCRCCCCHRQIYPGWRATSGGRVSTPTPRRGGGDRRASDSAVRGRAFPFDLDPWPPSARRLRGGGSEDGYGGDESGCGWRCGRRDGAARCRTRR
ncbi:unnamed protein product, partial [Ectocarpus fasciculatus]